MNGKKEGKEMKKLFFVFLQKQRQQQYQKRNQKGATKNDQLKRKKISFTLSFKSF